MAHTVTHLPYRGYVIVYDDRAADIWSGAEYVSTEYRGGVDAAMRTVDEWLDAK